jgi:hypothetical protein
MRILRVFGRSAKGTMTYSELSKRITSLRLGPDSLALRELLGEISAAEDSAGRGLLSAVVVHQGGDGRPGQGFFVLAKGLGRDTNDQKKCWPTELRRVRDVWKMREH